MAYIFTMFVRAVVFIGLFIAFYYVMSYIFTFAGHLFRIEVFTHVGKRMRSVFSRAIKKTAEENIDGTTSSDNQKERNLDE